MSEGWCLSVHPHVCGELDVTSLTVCCALGSSPRMRGTHVKLPSLTLVLRFIPTYAGNSDNCLIVLDVIAVHPHVCGELSCAVISAFTIGGSSPRMRGTLIDYRLMYAFYRFIPTYAGNSAICPSAVAILPVHPHVCGELKDPRYQSKTVNGSSPRMRGTLLVFYKKTNLYNFLDKFYPIDLPKDTFWNSTCIDIKTKLATCCRPHHYRRSFCYVFNDTIPNPFSKFMICITDIDP